VRAVDTAKSEIFKTAGDRIGIVASMIQLQNTSEFMASHARLIDRRRYELLAADGDREEAIAALAGFRNPDGGFGWALHPDLRAAASQPVAALHAFDLFDEVAPSTTPLAAGLCDWLESASLADGGLPFALAGPAGAGSAPMWEASDHSVSSLLITAGVCEAAHRVARHDSAVAEHPWLARATEHCLAAIAALEQPDIAITLRFALLLLDRLDRNGAAPAGELERLAALLPANATMDVVGGAEGERMRPLDFSPEPGGPLRELIDAEVIDADLDRLAGEQADDGGWDVDWHVYSPMAALEWRGDATVRAVKTLKANGRLN
jgi:hypothetical protein